MDELGLRLERFFEAKRQMGLEALEAAIAVGILVLLIGFTLYLLPWVRQSVKKAVFKLRRHALFLVFASGQISL